MRLGASILVALALFAGASDGTTTASTPNLRGVVLSGAVAPGCYPGEPCDPPVGLASYLGFRRSGHAMVRLRLARNGAFAIHLTPGWYRLSLAPMMGAAKLVPSVVHVPTTGIRRITVRVVRIAAPSRPASPPSAPR
jgi:hypothetical protein